jgi:WD40 repeat protein
VRIWDTDTGRQQLVLRIRDTPDQQGQLAFRPGSLAFSPDGTELIQASADGSVWSWPLDLDEAIRFVKGTLTRTTLTHQECQQYHLDPCP